MSVDFQKDGAALRFLSELGKHRRDKILLYIDAKVLAGKAARNAHNIARAIDMRSDEFTAASIVAAERLLAWTKWGGT